MKKSIRVAVALGLPVIALGLILIQLNAMRPRPIFKPVDAHIESFQIEPDGDLVIGLGKVNADIWQMQEQVVFDPGREKVLARHRINNSEWHWNSGLRVRSTNGWAVMLRSRNYEGGDSLEHNEGDPYWKNWLRLISPQGTVQALKKLPKFETLSDLKFTPDGGEVLALTDNVLWRYNLQSGRVQRVVRPTNTPLTPEGTFPKDENEVWCGDVYQSGAALTPDGRFIVGYHSNVDFQAYEDFNPTGSASFQLDRKRFYSDIFVYDGFTGRVVRRIKVPFSPQHGLSQGRPFKARFTADGEYLLAEGPSWETVHCIRWKDGKRVGVIDWLPWKYPGNTATREPVLSPDNRYFCDEDGEDIVIRSVLNGKRVRRAVQVLSTSEQAEGDYKLPSILMIAPDLSAIYLQPERNHSQDGRIWKWPLRHE